MEKLTFPTATPWMFKAYANEKVNARPKNSQLGSKCMLTSKENVYEEIENKFSNSVV